MSTRKVILVWLFFVIITIIFLIRSQPSLESTLPSRPKKTEKKAEVEHGSPESVTSLVEVLRARAVSPQPNLDKRITRYTDGSVDYNDSLAVSLRLHQSESAYEDLEIVDLIFQNYRYFYKENPVGTANIEFTMALTGQNAKQLNFIDPYSPALSDKNELLDRWGSPFWFHSISGTEIEIISLGPDRILWTEDDLKLGY